MELPQIFLGRTWCYATQISSFFGPVEQPVTSVTLEISSNRGEWPERIFGRMVVCSILYRDLFTEIGVLQTAGVKESSLRAQGGATSLFNPFHITWKQRPARM